MDHQTVPIILRPVMHDSETDRQAVLEVYRQCEDFLALGPVATASMEMVLADLALSREMGGLFCGIYDPRDGQMMGIVDYVACGYEGDPHMACLFLLMIAAPYRSGGLGAKVVQAVEEATRRAGARVIDSGVQVNNPGAQRFWQRMGYQIVSGPTPMPDQTVVFHLKKEQQIPTP